MSRPHSKHPWLTMVLGGCLAALTLLATSGCANLAMPKAPVVPPPGIIFTQFKAPLQVDFNEQAQGIPGPTSAESSRRGQSEAHAIRIWFIHVSWGDGALKTAANNGGISTITYADYDVLSVLGIYTKTTFIAHGK